MNHTKFDCEGLVSALPPRSRPSEPGFDSPARKFDPESLTKSSIIGTDKEPGNIDNGGGKEEGGKHRSDDYTEGDKSRQLKRVVGTLISTTPTCESFKINLACFIDPPKTISAALGMGNLLALRRLLWGSFNEVSQGEYSRLRELKLMGCRPAEIAELLLEGSSDSPWIFFDPDYEPTPDLEVKPEHHWPGCVHQLSWSSDHEGPTAVADYHDTASYLRKI